VPALDSRSWSQGGRTIAHHARRFFVESLPQGGEFTLNGDEAHHMLTVVRVRNGEEVILFDGSGSIAHARLLNARRGEANLQVLSVEQADVEPARPLTVACALPRSVRMDFLVEKCCELGLGRLIPMVTRRSVVDPTERQQNHLQRWKRITIEAAKQCGRARLTEISAVLSFESVLLTRNPETRRMVASPGPDAVPLADFAAGLAPNQPVMALVGPEGGFTPEELDLAKSTGCVPVSFGPRILRVETACVALTAFFLLGR
jgi:16S rRNA (uracil1498-N3)-methyltransferase